jgi:hypothetical protein
MPYFPNGYDFYRMLQRELPQGVYPDGHQGAFYSTADNAAIADVAATGYANLQQIYYNYWPQLCDVQSIAEFEVAYFGYQLDASLTLAERRDRVLVKLRARNGIRAIDMYNAVLAIIGSDKAIEIAPWCSSVGTWIIDENQLGITTYLGSGPRLAMTGPAVCGADPALYGLTPQQLAGIQQDAYTYSVLIYGYTLTALELATIDATLTAAEPARSTHKIYSGLDPGSQILPLLTIDGGPAFSVVYVDFIDGGSAFGTGIPVVDGGGAA